MFVKKTQNLRTLYYWIVFLMKYRLSLVKCEHIGEIRELLVKCYLDIWIETISYRTTANFLEKTIEIIQDIILQTIKLFSWYPCLSNSFRIEFLSTRFGLLIIVIYFYPVLCYNYFSMILTVFWSECLCTCVHIIMEYLFAI